MVREHAPPPHTNTNICIFIRDLECALLYGFLCRRESSCFSLIALIAYTEPRDEDEQVLASHPHVTDYARVSLVSLPREQRFPFPFPP